MTIRIVLIEDHQLVADAIATMLTSEEGMRIVAVGRTESDAIALAKAHTPDIVLMDVSLEHGDGISATRTLQTEVPETRVLMLTMHEDADTVTRALAAGARGYVPKHGGRNTLVSAILAVAKGQGYLDPNITGPFLDRVGPLADAAAHDGQLTAHELRVLRAVARGQSTKEVATEFGVSPETVKSHLRRIYQKLGVDDRVQAVATALRQGIID